MKKFPGKTRRRAEKADRGSARPSSSRQTPGHLSSKEDQRRPRFSKELSVLYEDDALVIVDKPAGLLAVPVEGSDAPSALSLLIAKLQPKRQRALIVHRIDRFASGALLFAKTASDREALVRQFLAHTPMRRYLAVVRGRIVDRTGAQTGARTGTAVHYFRREGMYQQLRTARDPRATRAEMRYSVERLFADASLVRVELETGLQNQIRAQFSAMGHPVIGDRKYHREEAAEPLIARVALHAAHLEFVHPRSGKSVSVECKLPADFQQLVRELGRPGRARR
jgi:23S rRNA pseudouridine1911/1915/1917 synthase